MRAARRLRLALIVGLTLLAGVAQGEPRAKPTPPPPLFGLNDYAPVLAEHANEAAALGANAAKLNVPWTNPPEWIEWIVDDVEAAGQRPIVTLYATEPPDPNRFAQAAVDYARAYPEAILQPLNEPNHHWFGSLSPGVAAAYVTQAARAVWAKAPGVKVIGPAVAPGTDLLEVWPYFKRLYRRMPDRLDPALHVYLYDARPMREIGRLYRHARRFGRVWVTELGFFGNTYGARQPFVTAQGYDKLARLGARAVIVHRALPSPDPSRWERAANMSILDRPAMSEALRNARQQ